MDESKKLLVKNYLANINVSLGHSGYQKVWPDWRDLDYIPGYNKFYYICDGEGWLSINGNEYYPKPGQMFLMPGGVKQSYSAINDNTFTKYWCHFTASVGDMNLFDVISLPYFIDVRERPAADGLFKRLIEGGESTGLTSALKVKAALLELISFYIENAAVGKINLSSSGTLDKLSLILNYIDSHLTENITVEKLAQLMHLHPNYFIKFFRRNLGTSPINYVNKRRIDRAKLIIETADDTLSMIAEKVGINDVYYLSKLFKEITGYSPSEYRKLVKGRHPGTGRRSPG